VWPARPSPAAQIVDQHPQHSLREPVELTVCHPLADFFTRKFGMAYYMQALVAAPGGFGTMDELFELMTLKQTGKMNRELPIVLFGKRYWQTVVNWQALAEFGTISQKEVDDLCFTDSIEEAFTFITNRLEGAHI
jgi:predicted Rossmann-fold nucleotide-binding protein